LGNGTNYAYNSMYRPMQAYKNFLKQYRVKSFAKGEIILVEGEVPATALVVKSGVIKTYNITADGQEKPITFDIEMEVFPLAWVFGKVRFCQFFYEAFTDCEVYSVPREDYVTYLKKHPDMLLDIFDYFVGRYINFQMRINALEQSKASDKVLNTLHFLALRYGKDIKSNLVRIELPLTQQDLANFMGLTRETTGLELKKLEKRGVISYQRQNYIVRTDKLDEILDDEYERGLIR